MARNHKFILVILGALFFVAGCTTVDLRTKELQTQGASSTLQFQGDAFLKKMFKAHDPENHTAGFSAVGIVAVDEWKANVLRLLTPIENPSQKIKFTFSLLSGDADMLYLDGKSAGNSFGIKDFETYGIKNGEVLGKKFRDVELYLTPVRNYFLWPLILKNSSAIAYAGEGLVGSQEYDKIFASKDVFFAEGDSDQCVVWINKNTGLVDYIEFTLRNLFKAYHGVVQYLDYRDTRGVWMPYEVMLTDQVGSFNYSHRFLVENIEFK